MESAAGNPRQIRPHMFEIVCERTVLENIRLWNYFTAMPRTLTYLAQDVYRLVENALGREPQKVDCVRPLTTAIAGLTSFREVMRKQQNLDPNLYRAFAGHLARCVLASHWVSIARA